MTQPVQQIGLGRLWKNSPAMAVLATVLLAVSLALPTVSATALDGFSVSELGYEAIGPMSWLLLVAYATTAAARLVPSLAATRVLADSAAVAVLTICIILAATQRYEGRFVVYWALLVFALLLTGCASVPSRAVHRHLIRLTSLLPPTILLWASAKPVNHVPRSFFEQVLVTGNAHASIGMLAFLGASILHMRAIKLGRQIEPPQPRRLTDSDPSPAGEIAAAAIVAPHPRPPTSRLPGRQPGA